MLPTPPITHRQFRVVPLAALMTVCLSVTLPSFAETAPTVVRAADTVHGSLTRIASGDTITVTVQRTCQRRWCPQVGERVNVHLSSVDAPEPDQPFGQEAIQAVSRLIGNRSIAVAKDTLRPDGAIEGQVFHDESWVNRDLVASGYGWSSPDTEESSPLREYQQRARAQQQGLWDGSHPAIPPWDWREGIRAIDVEAVGQAADGLLSRLTRFVKRLWHRHGEDGLQKVRQAIPAVDDTLRDIETHRDDR